MTNNIKQFDLGNGLSMETATVNFRRFRQNPTWVEAISKTNDWLVVIEVASLVALNVVDSNKFPKLSTAVEIVAAVNTTAIVANTLINKYL